MPMFLRNHIVINNRTETFPYTSNNSGRSKIEARTDIQRIEHGGRIRDNFNEAVRNFKLEEDLNFVYLVFRSPLNFYLDIDKLDKGNFRLSSYKAIETTDAEGNPAYHYEAAVYLNKRAISTFLEKVEAFISLDTKNGNPRNQSLIANIDEIRAATLESFWQEPEIPFPNVNEDIWWEVWLDRDVAEENPIDSVIPLLEAAEVRVGDKTLLFPEHGVYLLRGTVEQLGASLLYSDKLSEIRKPKETAEFFTYLDRQEQNQWIDDLRGRVDHHANNSIISVCLLDTGVNRTNPLLEDIIPERNLDSINPAWTNADTHRQGHGTPMAGLIMYGDLVESLSGNARIQIYHHLESIKLIGQGQDNAHDPSLYGAVTQEAVARGQIINPNNKRVICMAVTTDESIHKGQPSSWSSAIDQTIFGNTNDPNDYLLFFISSGNAPDEEKINYPISNDDFSVQDPAQAFNAITVGAYTIKDQIISAQHVGSTPLAPRGGMSASNTTSITWDKDWCRKPDIVMEGGNHGLLNGEVFDADSLQLLSTAKGGVGRSWLTTFSDTSAATALASRFAAELYFQYPTLLPETIRGLMIHSADWTPAMLGNRNMADLNINDKAKLLSRVGYGVPSMEKAKYSANNSLSLIIERTLTPYKKDASLVKTNEFHLFDLPWPREVLQELFDTQVKLKLTLSYFVEPNPGNKKYELSASYRSHGLRFKIIDSNERESSFKARVSKAMKEEDYEREGGEHWRLGSQVRDKGSIHKDIWEGTAADLATRNKIAVYPVGGWWKSRKQLNRYDNSVRYSLIVTIETPSENVDIYTPVLNQIAIEL